MLHIYATLRHAGKGLRGSAEISIDRVPVERQIRFLDLPALVELCQSLKVGKRVVKGFLQSFATC